MPVKKKDPVVKSKRLVIRPMSDEEIENLIMTPESDELSLAYREMLAGCRAHPQSRIWYAPWGMYLKSDGTYIGDLGFKGPVCEHSVEIGYGILPAYEGKGYTTEAVHTMVQWAFGNPEVVFVEAETEPNNGASQRILEKCGFKPDGTGAEGPRFVLERPMTSWIAVYMLFGLSIGMSLGVSLGSVGVGMCIGMCLGLSLGAVLDSNAKKERQKQLEQRRQRKEQHPGGKPPV